MGRLADFLAPQVLELQSFQELDFKVDGPSSSTGHPDRQDRFSLGVPVCSRHVKWHVSFDALRPTEAPDVIFSEGDELFQPLVPDPSLSQSPDGGAEAGSSWALLRDWQPGDRARLLKLILALRRLYLRHHWALAETVENPKVGFELSTLAHTPGTEAYAVQSGQWGDRIVEEVHISVPVLPLDFSAVAPFRAFSDLFSPAHGSSRSKPKLALQVVFDARQGASSGGGPNAGPLPQVTLERPPLLDTLLSLTEFRLPPWTDTMCMIEYEPLVREQLQAKVSEAAAGLHTRSGLLSALPAYLGPLLEVDTVSFLRTTVQLGYENFFFLLHILLTPKFPNVQPSLQLESIQHFDATGRPLFSQVFDSYPWSPRWSLSEMARRITAFAQDEAVRFRSQCR